MPTTNAIEKAFLRTLQTRLQKISRHQTKQWWERYLRGVIPFRGVPMKEIRRVLHGILADWGDRAALSPAVMKRIAFKLIQQRHTEDKLSGILLLREVLLVRGHLECGRDVPRFAALFRKKYIYDWNTCDWFCVKVLGPLIQRQGRGCARAVAEWKRASNLWQQRASVVAFVNLARRGDDNFPGFVSLLLTTCSVVVRSRERFCQTGVGWVLRELSKGNRRRVEQFIRSHVGFFSSEGLSYATAAMPASTRRVFAQSHASARVGRRV